MANFKISDAVTYVGVDDKDIDLFESQYDVPNGMAYHSYVILDEKIAVMDSVERKFGAEWLMKLEEALEGRTPDYLIVQHMEPDHSASIQAFAEKFPEAVIVGNKKTFKMIGQFFPELELPEDKNSLGADTQQLTHRAKALIKDLAAINLEIAQMVISSEDGGRLPDWFMMEIVRDLPRLAGKMNK